jgi:hypothetical protein
MLHILNGDALYDGFPKQDPTDKLLVWREILVEGPVSPTQSLPDFFKQRGDFLADTFGTDAKAYLQERRENEALLQSSLSEDTILWFDQDLFCRINYIFLLSWLFRLGKQKGIYSIPPRTLAKNEGNIQSVFLSSTALPGEELKKMDRVWSAYSSDQPEELLNLMNESIREKSHLRNALQLHFQRYPSTENGINRLEEELLLQLEHRKIMFPTLVSSLLNTTLFQWYGWGDWQIVLLLRQLAEGPSPLVTADGLDELTFGAPSPESTSLDLSVELTKFGHQVLDGSKDRIKENGIQLWLGGVHLEGTRCWRWNAEKQELVYQ